MNLETLLSTMSKAEFVEGFFHKLPYASAGTAKPVCHLATWDTLEEILASSSVDAMIVRDGKQYGGATPTSRDEAMQLSEDGYTILVRHAERHHEGIQQLANSFRLDFNAPVNVHIYATPPGRHGFSWHYDAEDVLIMQTTGQKEYALRKNTVHPWPLVETIPHDMRYEREQTPLMSVLLKAGDWLYIPCGYWHKAEAIESADTAISLALGIMSPSAVSLYDFLRTRLLDSLLWRQRLPISRIDGVETDHSSTQEEQMEHVSQQLVADFSRMLRDQRTISDFLEWSREINDDDRAATS